MNYRIINFQQHGDARGMLVALEEDKEVPFQIRRVYFMYDTGEKVRRGYHAHMKLEQILICVHGSCKIRLDDGMDSKEIILDKPYQGLYLSSNVWREMYDFKEGTVLLVLASELYDESNYICDYQAFSGKFGDQNQAYKLRPLEIALSHARRGILQECEIGTIDSLIDVPFDIKRVFYIFDTLDGVVRGNHANLRSQFALICLSGSCRVRVRKSADSAKDEIFLLDQSHKVLVLSEFVWKEMYDFTPGAVLLCLSSEVYDSSEYVRKFNDFLDLAATGMLVGQKK